MIDLNAFGRIPACWCSGSEEGTGIESAADMLVLGRGGIAELRAASGLSNYRRIFVTLPRVNASQNPCSRVVTMIEHIRSREATQAPGTA